MKQGFYPVEEHLIVDDMYWTMQYYKALISVRPPIKKFDIGMLATS